MATTHHLFGMSARTATEDGASVALAGRTRLTATLLVAAISGTLAVVIEASPTGETGSWTTLATFSVSATDSSNKTSIDDADWTPQAWHKFLRARVSTITSATFEVTLLAPFVTASVDSSLFSKELRSFSDGFTRIVGEAEDEVVAQLAPRVNAVSAPERRYTPDVVPGSDTEVSSGAPAALLIDADMTLPGFGAEVRKAIVKQAEHVFQRHRLSQRDDAASIVTLRTFPHLAPGLMVGLQRYRNTTSTVYRGR